MTKDQNQTEQAVRYLIDDLRNLVDLTTWQQDVVDRAASALSQVRGKAQKPVVNSAMMNAGADAMREGMGMLKSGRSYQSVCIKIFEAMLAAAPQVAHEHVFVDEGSAGCPDYVCKCGATPQVAQEEGARELCCFKTLQAVRAALSERRDQQAEYLREGMEKAINTVDRMMLKFPKTAPQSDAQQSEKGEQG